MDGATQHLQTRVKDALTVRTLAHTSICPWPFELTDLERIFSHSTQGQAFWCSYLNNLVQLPHNKLISAHHICVMLRS